MQKIRGPRMKTQGPKSLNYFSVFCSFKILFHQKKIKYESSEFIFTLHSSTLWKFFVTNVISVYNENNKLYESTNIYFKSYKKLCKLMFISIDFTCVIQCLNGFKCITTPSCGIFVILLAKIKRII